MTAGSEIRSCRNVGRGSRARTACFPSAFVDPCGSSSGFDSDPLSGAGILIVGWELVTR